MPDQYIPIGFTKKPYGPKGDLKVSVEEKYLPSLLKCDVVFFKVQQKPLPFFVEKFRTYPDQLLKLEDIDTPQDAKPYTATEIFIRETNFIPPPLPPPRNEDELTYDMLVGYLLIDAERGPLGTILEVQEFPQHDIAVVDFGGREILIPLHEDLIETVDPDAKKITLLLPEGLLDL